ncbi:peptide ABC transporter substrate-binding protein [Aquibacillus sp. 3ASR75-11]|uniref:Peptide ABC transporter substrate-binding protein n=1 Tax=Terrihalobacillus insolitus TaxID=2950438 RepID=A0A9X4AN30_9BACI|nr:peptide ABC transporter substrate-binding protein [Terrihalobacillus insolitus]MDC3425424.1 peptide ABC transporter substrate-binding protein [Terrihalobacillus insolitus]
MRKKNWLLLVLALVLSVFLAACSGGSEEGEGTDEGNTESESEGTTEEGGEEAAEVEQILRITDSTEIPTMDPQLSTNTVSSQWLGATMEGLYRVGKDGEPEPGIATGYEVSDDALTWTFNLREDAVWSNGDPVTANDFVYSWRRAVDPDVGSEYGPYMMGGVIKNANEVASGDLPIEDLGVKADGDYTFIVELEKPTPYMESLATFTTFYPMNQSFVEEQGDQFGLEADTLVFNGAFVMSEWNHGEGWVLKKNEDYWDSDTVKLETIDVKVTKDVPTNVNLYNNDQIDRTGLTADFVDQYRSNEEFKTVLNPGVFYLKFNQTRNEALANVNIRKALATAFDKEGIASTILNNGSIAAGGLVAKKFVSDPDSGEDFREINGDLLPYDVEKAKEYWKKGLDELGTDSVTLEYLTGDTETSTNISAFMKNQLETNLEGLSLDIKQVPFKERLRLDTAMDYDIQAAGWVPDYADPNTWLNMWVTDGANNKMGFSSDKYDSMLEKANNELAQKPNERFQTFLDMEKLLIQEEAAIAPMYQEGVAQLWKPYVKDVFKNLIGPEYSYKFAYIEK